MNLIDRIVQFHHDIRDIRRDIHAHPELRFQETRTSDLIAQRLQSWGIAVTRGLGGTGVVGTIRRGTSSRSIGLRADIDALPMREANTFAHRSRHEGRMHACGHDGHTAMLLGAARFLADHQGFDGTVHLLGRGSVCINTGGEKVYPEEVEVAARSHDGVEDCVAVGVPHERFGQAVTLVASRRAGSSVSADEIIAHVKSLIADYKAPKSVVFVDAVYRSPSGKADYRWAQQVATAG